MCVFVIHLGKGLMMIYVPLIDFSPSCYMSFVILQERMNTSILFRWLLKKWILAYMSCCFRNMSIKFLFSRYAYRHVCTAYSEQFIFIHIFRLLIYFCLSDIVT